MSISKCRTCTARWRTNYPYGKKQKGVTTSIWDHANTCPHNEKNKRKFLNKRQHM